MTKRKITPKQGFLILILAVFVAGFSSCRTGRNLPSSRLKPITSEKLLDQARRNAFDFEDLVIRRINVQFSDEASRTSFRANLKAIKNEKILASISKLNIPVGRVLLTPDSVTYVNYIDKNYYEGNYSYISNLLNFHLTFNVVQAVISNPVKSGIVQSGMDDRRLEASVEDGKYVLQPENPSNGWFSEQRLFPVRNSRSRYSGEKKGLVIKKLVFHPQTFVLERLVLDDPDDDRRLEVDFSDFEKVEGYDYPGAIDVRMYSGEELTELNIKLRGFSTDKIDSIGLNIPERYQQLRTR